MNLSVFTQGFGIGISLIIAIGACTASFVWFFGLAYGARILIPIFKKEITWKILDIVIGLIMLRIASKLVFFALDNHLIG